MSNVSLLLLTRNEEKLLPTYLAWHQPFFQEIIIFDSNSTDQTREIAREAGCIVVVDKRTPVLHLGRMVSPLREILNERNKYVSTEWAFSIDCDELADYTFMKNMDKWIEQLDAKNHFAIKFSRFNSDGRDYPDWQIRFYNKTHCYWGGDLIHAVVSCKHNELPCDSIDSTNGNEPIKHCMTLDSHPIIHLSEKDRWAKHW